MGGRRTSAVHNLAIGFVVCGIFGFGWWHTNSGSTRGVTAGRCSHGTSREMEGKWCTPTKPMALYEYGQRSIQGSVLRGSFPDTAFASG